MSIIGFCIFFLLGWWTGAIFITKHVGLGDWIVTLIFLFIALIAGMIERKKK